MQTLVALETRFDRTPDRRVWTDGAFGHAFWQRYLTVFEAVHVVARVREVLRPADGLVESSGPDVCFVEIPYYVGPWQYGRRFLAVRRALRGALTPDVAVLLRTPGTMANGLAAELIRRGQPYGVEVVGDPNDVFAPGGGVRSVLRPLMRRWYRRHLGRQCAGACAAAYVTSGTLQSRYPPAPGAFATHYSSIELQDEAFAAAPRMLRPDQRRFRAVLVGSLDQLYKGPDVLIEAVACCAQRQLELHAVIVGDGRHRAALEAQARRLGVEARVQFKGRLAAGECVRAALDAADLFAMPSRTEGLPKALIEAMARGLPCIASRVGGIPELLPDEDLVEPGSITDLVTRLHDVLGDRDRYARMAARNLERARQYHASILNARRRAFYEAVRDATDKWRRACRQT